MRAFELALARAARHRQWHWCRRPNGFSDNAKWRVVAERVGLPLHKIVAFVNRLEEFANGADSRGSVMDFRASEFAVALEISIDEAQRIFDTLSTPDIEWIDQGHLATFYQRNPDKEDATAVERQRRSRAKKDIRKRLAMSASVGRITKELHFKIDLVLERLDDEAVFELQQNLRLLRFDQLEKLSLGHSVTARDSVTVTPREEQTNEKTESRAEFNSNPGPATPRLNADDQSTCVTAAEQEQALKWLNDAGATLLVQRMGISRTAAEVKLQRWVHEMAGDAAKLSSIVLYAAKTDLGVAHFHTKIAEEVARYVSAREASAAH